MCAGRIHEAAMEPAPKARNAGVLTRSTVKQLRCREVQPGFSAISDFFRISGFGFAP